MSKSGARILVVDDEIEILRALQRSLSAHGFEVFTAGPLSVDFVHRLVQVNGQEVKLTPTEYDLLKALIKNSGKIMTRQMLLSQVWGTGYGAESHYLHVYVGQLRRKIEPDPAHPRFILTISGVGYRFNADEEVG